MQSVHQSASNNDSKRTLTKHIIVKFQNARNRDLTASREKKWVDTKERNQNGMELLNSHIGNWKLVKVPLHC